MKDLVIIGAGGFGREVLDVVEAINAEKATWVGAAPLGGPVLGLRLWL